MKYLLAVFAALLVLALGAASAAAAPAPGVTVLGEEGTQVAVFKKAKCTKTKRKSFFLTSTSTNGQYELSAVILRDFSGFHSYDLALEDNPSDYLRVSPKGSAEGGWSNEFVPPYPVPGFGEINFTPNGKQVGLGFGPAMWNREFTSAVVVAGGLECTYPKKKKGK
jgi:opacity protein-like surface antigen